MDFEHNNSVMSLSQSRVSNINNMLLQLLFPSEHAVKTYLYQDQDDNNENSNCDQSSDSSNKANLNLDRLYFQVRHRFRSRRSEFDYPNLYDLTSASIYSDIINQLVFDLVHYNNLNLEALNSDEYENPETYYQYYEDYQASQSYQSFTYNDYVKLRGNTLLLTRLGYKLTLTLNTDNDKVPETWNPIVAQKILSVEFSPLSLKLSSNLFSAQASLDQPESLLIAELVIAFQDDEPNKLPDFSTKYNTDPSPAKFVSIFRKVDSFRKLCDSDKIVLLSSAFYEVISMNVIFKYNQSTDEWTCPEYGTRFGRRDLFIWNRLLHDAAIPAIETLPDRWRKDEVVETLINLIITFNPDLVGLESPDSVRHEQYVYIHLLKRYLESVCESICDASDNLYRLLVGVEKFRQLGEISFNKMNEFDIGYHKSLRNLILGAINKE